MPQANIITEIQEARKDIKTDRYDMSVGELINLYEDNDLSLNPAYQRLFRWDDEQKTNFIESLILGFPIPPIFVSQDTTGHWDIVDGVQRVSTIIQLAAALNGYDKLKLTTCKYIPSLQDETWDTLPKEVSRVIKRAKLSINIILTEDNVTAQYEVFQRLNTGGLHLSPQEIRNCLIIMSNEDFYNQINDFKKNESLMITTPITEDKFKEEYRMELIIRFLIAKNNSVDYEKYKISSTHLKDFIDSELTALIDNTQFSLADELNALSASIKFLADTLGKNAFSKYITDSESFEEKFSLQIFEVLLPGLTANFDKVSHYSKEQLQTAIKDICIREDFKQATRRGTKAINRFKSLTEISHSHFTGL